MSQYIRSAIVTAILGISATCSSLDTDRTVEPYSSFGVALYREACQHVAYTGQLAQKQAGLRDTVDVSGSLGHSVCVDGSPAPADAPAPLKAVQAQRDVLVTAVDGVAPHSLLTDVEGFLEAILPLADDGTTPTAIRSLGELLGVLEDNAELPTALARIAVRHGYRPPSTAAGPLQPAVSYPELDALFTQTLALIVPSGTARAEWQRLLAALSLELRATAPVGKPLDPERTLTLGLNLGLSTHPDFASGKALPVVLRDARGLAQVAKTAGKLVTPFVDQDGDGLADIDAAGRFVAANGQPLNVPTPFPVVGEADSAPRDTLGRALLTAQSTTLLYNYIDLDPTVLGGLARETPALMDPKKDLALGLLWGGMPLLGARQAQTKVYTDAAGAALGTLQYPGFQTDRAALLDLLHGFVQLFGDPGIDPTLQAAQTLLTQYESPTARLVGAMLNASDRSKAHPEAQLSATATLFDDLMPLIVRTLRVPGLLQDLIVALNDKHLRGFAPMMARLMTARNLVDFDHSSAPAYALTANLDAVQPVDRTQPDADYNRSLLQRIAHLIHDSNGIQFCNKEGATNYPLNTQSFKKCDLFEVDDLALLFVLNIASPSVITATQNDAVRKNTTYLKANYCEQIKDPTAKALAPATIQGPLGTNITGFTCMPTPQALTRTLLLRNSEKSGLLQAWTEDGICTDGDKFIDVHDKSLAAWEATLANNPSGFPNDTFYDAVRPIVDAFAKHDECVARDANGACTKLQNAAKIFIDIFSTLHTHYASAKSSYSGHTYQTTNAAQPRFARIDNMVSDEPLLAEVLGQADLVPALQDLAPILLAINTDGTPKGGTGKIAVPDALAATAQYFLDPAVAAQNGIAYRSGAITTVWSDGKTPVPQTTPYYMIADGFAGKRAAFAGAAAAPHAAWDSASSGLVDQLLTVKQTGTQYSLQNRHARALTLNIIDFLRQRIAAHKQAGDLPTWVHKQLTQDITDKLAGPVAAALCDLVAQLEANPAARDLIYRLVLYLVDETNNRPAFVTTVTSLGDLLQAALDDPSQVALAHAAGIATDAARGTVDAQLTLVNKAQAADKKRVLLTLLRNLMAADATGNYPAAHLMDVLSEVNRTQPGHGGDLDANDEKKLLGAVRDFLLDEQNGFTRFLNIVETRGPH